MTDSDKKCPCGCGMKGCVCSDDCKGDCIGKASDSDKNKKKGMVMVISVGGKPPKSPEDTSKPDVKKAPIPEATAGMGEKPRESGGLPGLQGIMDSMNSSVGQAKERREEFDASEEGRALAEGPQEEQDFRQLDRHGDEIKPGPTTAATQEQLLQQKRREEGNLEQLNTDEIQDTHSHPVLPRPVGVDPPMPDTSPADVGALPTPRPERKKLFPPAPRPVIGAPSTIADFKEGKPARNIFAMSFDGPLNHAWALLKFVNKRKYAQMVPEDKDSQPGGVYGSPSEENEEDQPTTSLEHLLQLLGENPDLYDEETSGLGDEVQNERSPARGLSNLQDPFRMKRPEMESEMSDMGQEEIRRFSPEVLGYRWPAKDWHGQEEDEGEMPQFSMDKPEMGKRRQDLQSEIARRGKPALDE